MQLTSHLLDQGRTPLQAARETLARLDGAFALAFVFEGADDLIICARRGSPLCLGHGRDEMFLGSDAIALAEMTDRITYLEEGDLAVLTHDGAQIFDVNDGKQTNRPVTRINLDTVQCRQIRPQAFHGQGNGRTARDPESGAGLLFRAGQRQLELPEGWISRAPTG